MPAALNLAFVEKKLRTVDVGEFRTFIKDVLAKFAPEERYEAETRITARIIQYREKTDDLLLDWNEDVISQKSYRNPGVKASQAKEDWKSLSEIVKGIKSTRDRYVEHERRVLDR